MDPWRAFHLRLIHPLRQRDDDELGAAHCHGTFPAQQTQFCHFELLGFYSIHRVVPAETDGQRKRSDGAGALENADPGPQDPDGLPFFRGAGTGKLLPARGRGEDPAVSLGDRMFFSRCRPIEEWICHSMRCGVLSTGYLTPMFPFLPDPYRVWLEGEKDGPQLYRHMLHPRIPRLAFAGFNHGYM